MDRAFADPPPRRGLGWRASGGALRRPRRRGALGRFWRARDGATAIEGALSVSVLVIALAGLLGIVHTLYSADELGRAARAAARAVALLPAAPASVAALDEVACGAIRRELGLEASFDCAAAWTITIDAYATPEDLLAGTARGGDTALAGENGDMILVRIARSDPFSPLAWLTPDANAQDPDAEDDDVSMVAMAVARNERATTE